MKHKKTGSYLLLLLLFLTFGCSKNKGPHDSFQAYIDAWGKSEFSTMYQKLDIESKAAFTEKDFIEKYTTIYSGIEVKKISVLPEYPPKYKKDSKGMVSIPFTVSLDTPAGEIKFSHVALFKEEEKSNKKQWVLRWNSKMIFPDLGEGEKVRIDKSRGERGEIRDRSNNPLAINGTVAEIGIVPQKLGSNSTNTKKQIAQILNIPLEQIEKKLSASYVKQDMFVSIAILSKEEIAKINKLKALKGIVITSKPFRVYPLKEVTAHLTGYVQKISSEELEKLSSEGYLKDDFIGRAGLEKTYEKTLRAENGAEIYIVDKTGNKKKVLAHKDAKDGTDLKLTIDTTVQSSLYEELKEDASVAVAMQPKTGEILALVSAPSFDPNKFVLGISDSEWQALNSNPKKPFSNRFQRTFTPGSVIKPITAAIGLKTGKIDPTANKNIIGFKWQKNKGWGNYNVTRLGDYKGPSNLLNALIHSDNIYFAQGALDIGKETFETEIKNLGIGEKIPFEYATYNSQLSSDGTLKNEIMLADSGYGQGEFLMNPIQLAAIFTSFVNEGNILTPTLELKENPTPIIWKPNAFSPQIAQELLKDLTQIVESPEGTGHQAYMKDLPLAGKTGTAEIKQSQGDTTGTELGWFEVVNTQNPKFLLVAMVEDVKARGGSHYVVPKLLKTLEQFAK